MTKRPRDPNQIAKAVIDRATGERDFERDPYSPAETRVARWFFNRGVGGGDDPIGALIASHEMVVAERNALRAEIRRLRRASGEETKR